MKITEWTSIIFCFISFVELVVIGILTFAAFKMNTDYNNWQRQVVENDRTPVPIVESSCVVDLGEHCRYYYKEKIPGIDVNGQIPTYRLEEEDVKAFLNKKQSVYFSNVFGKNCIVLNMLDNENYILLEHCPTRVTCKNIGGEFQSIKIESVYIKLISGPEITLLGNGEPFPCPTSKGETFEFYLDQITNGDNNLCHIDENVLAAMHPGMNLIGTDFNPFVLAYTESIIRISFINGTDSYTYDIGVKRKDNKLVPVQERVR